MISYPRSLSALSLGLLLLCSCHSVDRSTSDWNSAGVWKPLSAQSGAYAPRDLPEKAALASENGSWVIDPKDGCRFFVPHQGTQAYTAAILGIEAMKATNRATWTKLQTPNLPADGRVAFSFYNPNAGTEASKVKTEESDSILQDDSDPPAKQTAPSRSSPTEPSRPRGEAPDDPQQPSPPKAPEQAPGEIPREGRP